MAPRRRVGMTLAIPAVLVALGSCERAATADEELPEVLDVDRRVTTLRLVEVHPFVGTLVGDKLHSSLQTGGHVDFRLAPQVSIGGLFAWSPAELDPQSALGRVVTDADLFLIQSVFAFHVPGAFLLESMVVEMDVCGEIGAGLRHFNGDDRAALFLGGAAKLYFDDLPWLGVRADIGTQLASIRTSDGEEVSSDFSLTIGPVFRFPPDLDRARTRTRP